MTAVQFLRFYSVAGFMCRVLYSKISKIARLACSMCRAESTDISISSNYTVSDPNPCGILLMSLSLPVDPRSVPRRTDITEHRDQHEEFSDEDGTLGRLILDRMEYVDMFPMVIFYYRADAFFDWGMFLHAILLGNAVNPESLNTYINMPISTHSSVRNLLNSSTYGFAPNQSLTYLPKPSVTIVIDQSVVRRYRESASIDEL